jgi:nitroreductase
MKFMNPNSNTLSITEIIQQRRTIKPNQFSDRPIEPKIITELLENANWAPTHGMTQPWRFSVFTGDARQKLADFLAATYQELTAPEDFKPKKYEGMKENALLSQAVIAIGMKRQESEKIAELDELLAVACAVQNMHLSAAAHGLGAYWSTNVAATSDNMRDYLGLGPKDRALGLFYLGYPACEWPSSSRQSLDDCVRWISG